jgi:hypothetical protein
MKAPATMNLSRPTMTMASNASRDVAMATDVDRARALDAALNGPPDAAPPAPPSPTRADDILARMKQAMEAGAGTGTLRTRWREWEMNLEPAPRDMESLRPFLRTYLEALFQAELTEWTDRSNPVLLSARVPEARNALREIRDILESMTRDHRALMGQVPVIQLTDQQRRLIATFRAWDTRNTGTSTAVGTPESDAMWKEWAKQDQAVPVPSAIDKEMDVAFPEPEEGTETAPPPHDWDIARKMIVVLTADTERLLTTGGDAAAGLTLLQKWDNLRVSVDQVDYQQWPTLLNDNQRTHLTTLRRFMAKGGVIPAAMPPAPKPARAKDEAKKLPWARSAEQQSREDLRILYERSQEFLDVAVLPETQATGKETAKATAMRLVDEWDKLRAAVGPHWVRLIKDKHRSMIASLRTFHRMGPTQQKADMSPKKIAAPVGVEQPVPPAPPTALTQEMPPADLIASMRDSGSTSQTQAFKEQYMAQDQKTATQKPNGTTDGQTAPTTTQRALTTLNRDAHDAAWRTAASQFVKMVQEPGAALVSRHLGPDDDALRGKVADFMKTEIGGAMLASILSLGLSAMPLTDPRVERLARELRVRAMTGVGDVVTDALMGPLRQVMALYLQGMPELEQGPAQLGQGTSTTAVFEDERERVAP